MRIPIERPISVAEAEFPPPPSFSSRLTLGLVLGPVVFNLAWVVLGFVNTGYSLWDIHVDSYSAISQPISGLGLGNTAPFMNSAFVVSGLLLIAGAFGFASQIPALSSRTRRMIAGLIALHGVGAVISGIFTLESADLHFLGFLFGLSPVVTFYLVGRWLRQIPRWARFGSWLRWASPLTAILVVAFFVTFDPIAGAEAGIAGLTQRMLFVEMQMWFVLMGLRS